MFFPLSLVGLNVTPARRTSTALLRAVAPLSAFRFSPLSFLDFMSSGARNRLYCLHSASSLGPSPSRRDLATRPPS